MRGVCYLLDVSETAGASSIEELDQVTAGHVAHIRLIAVPKIQ